MPAQTRGKTFQREGSIHAVFYLSRLVFRHSRDLIFKGPTAFSQAAFWAWNSRFFKVINLLNGPVRPVQKGLLTDLFSGKHLE